MDTHVATVHTSLHVATVHTSLIHFPLGSPTCLMSGAMRVLGHHEYLSSSATHPLTPQGLMPEHREVGPASKRDFN